jgi:RimK family alpha-L-glutamate ligase
MRKIQKYILLNAGTRTRKAFIEGLEGQPYEWYRTKFMLLHVASEGKISFIYNNKPIDWKGAYVLTRLRASDQHFCGILYDYLAYNNIPANDPINQSYINSAEKISQMLKLTEHGIPVPDTLIFREESYEKNHAYIRAHCSFPLIYKIDGSKGRNVRYVESQKQLELLVKNKKPKILALVQPFVPNEFDTRTIVAFGKVFGTIKRTRAHGYLNNIAQGAVPSAYELTDSEKEMAIKASRVCGIDVAGVDMIHTEHGPRILEINKSPQTQGFESVHGFKVFTKIAELLKENNA